jgi:rhamnulokinase
MSWHLAIDLGAGSGRAMLARVCPDELRLEEVHRFRYPPRRVAGRLRWDIERLFEGVRTGVIAAGERTAGFDAHVGSVGVDSWGVDYGLLDQAGRLVEEPICYRDERTDGVMDDVFASVPRDEIFARTGIQFHQLNTLYQLVAHVRDGMPSDASRLLLIPDLCHHLLCGAQVAERTDASTTQLVNIGTGQWDADLFGRLGLPLDLMPPLVSTGTDIGPLRSGLSGGRGLDGTRVIAPPTHDTASAVAGTPLEPGWAYISSGTWSLVGIERIGPILNDDASLANFTNEAGAFGTVRFLKNVMGLWLLESCRREWDAAGSPADLESLISRVAAVDRFAGLVYPDDQRFFNPPSMVRALGEALAETGQEALEDPVLLTRVIVDSLALRYASVIERIEQITGESIRGIHVVGGGSLNECLNQATADATGRPVVAGPIEATAIGNILVQAVATLTLPSLAHGRELVRRTQAPRRFEPSASRAWSEAACRYQDLEAGAR